MTHVLKRAHPTDVQILVRSAHSAEAAGRFAQAEEICRRILASQPSNVQALLIKGIVTAKMGRPAEAIEHMNAVLRVDGENSVALGWLSVLLRETGRIEEAVACAQRVVRLRPDEAESYHRLGLCYMARSRHHDAMLVMERACEIEPGNATFRFGLGAALDALGRPWDAIRALRKAAKLAPQLNGLIRLAHLLLAQSLPAEALEYAEQAVAMKPDSAPAHLIQAEALTALERDGQAARAYREACALDPGLERSYSFQRAKHLQSLGRMEEAVVHYRKALEADPESGGAYYGLATSRKMTEADRPLVAEMDEALKRSLEPQSRIHVHFALGKVLDELGDYERAMRHFDQANALLLEGRHASQRYRPEVFERRVDAQISLFTQEFLDETRRFGSKSGLPILISGMMGSGTTLAAQILTRHAAVGYAGEQSYWSFNEMKLVDYADRTVEVAKLRPFADGYTELLSEITPGNGFVADGDPTNTFVLGLIHCALPNARIIHMKRNPVDTCLSTFMTAAGTPSDFGNDRDNIAFAYRQCERLRAHWRRVLPSDRFIEVRYEDLITKREGTTRRMLEFCGLEWSDACLDPEGNEEIGTYGTSMEKWRRYEPWLGAFRYLLEEDDSKAKQS